ncbi:MAG: hypothetical protein IPH75_05305 [bacterium]|nr:hypothetical protein [bacterium]
MGRLLDTLDRQEELRKRRRGLLVEKIDNANAKEIVAQVGTEQVGPPDPIAINPLGPYSSSYEFMQVVKKAQEQGMDALTADERRSVESAVNHKIIDPQALEPTKPWARLKAKIKKAEAETVNRNARCGGVGVCVSARPS